MDVTSSNRDGFPPPPPLAHGRGIRRVIPHAGVPEDFRGPAEAARRSAELRALVPVAFAILHESGPSTVRRLRDEIRVRTGIRMSGARVRCLLIHHLEATAFGNEPQTGLRRYVVVHPG